MNKKILVIGLGSMGRRRIRLIRKYFPEWEVCGVDTNQERCKVCFEEYNVKTWDSIESAVAAEEFSCAFVCTSPLSHADIINKCLSYKFHFFTEINLVSAGYEENMELAKRQGVKLFLSSTMIYRDEMQYLAKNIDQTKKYAYTYHVGQYLPDWHPWESYKDFFIGKKETNGCREILAIELPWIRHVFGEIESVQFVKSKVTDLDIEFEDCYMLLIRHKNQTVGTFVVDVVACEPIRDLKILGENVYIKWEGEPEGFYYKKGSSGKMEQICLYGEIERQEGYNKTIVENEYVNELKQFFGELSGEADTIYGFADDLDVLALIDEVEGI